MRIFDSKEVTARPGRRYRRVCHVVAAMLALAAANGATVTVPFTIKVKSSVPLGPTESGRHHVHIWFDANENDYQVVESDSLEVTNLPAGQHTVHVSLRNANHSPAGADTQTMVVVGGGDGAPAATPSPSAATPSPGPPMSEEPDPGYDY
jgi:hypothetical protein